MPPAHCIEKIGFHRVHMQGSDKVSNDATGALYRKDRVSQSVTDVFSGLTQVNGGHCK